MGWPVQIPLSWVPPDFSVPLPVEGTTPIEYAEVLGETYLAFARQDQRKNVGHYLTPARVARFMAECGSYEQPHLRVLDPGSGTGILSAAVCQAACKGRAVKSLHVDAYENVPLLAGLTQIALAFSRHWLGQKGVTLTFDVKQDDFVLRHAAALEAQEMSTGHRERLASSQVGYDLVISNPPYFKIGKDDPRAVVGMPVAYGHPNIYALFMTISAELLSESGRLVYIVPRSFASGSYFRRFREVFFQRVTPTAIHLFDSRKDVFKSQAVLQESLVLTAQSHRDEEGQVLISHSKATHDLAGRQRILVGLKSVLDLRSANKVLCIPVCYQDLELVETIRTWPSTLHSLGLDISTGPVVPFRAKEFLTNTPLGASTIPLLWMHHVRPMRVEWPSAGTDKPQWVRVAPELEKLLVREETYVLLRRFSAKEEKRRLVAAPILQGFLKAPRVGLENHLNYIRGVSRDLDEELAWGVAALLNSSFLDRYFRVSNGNTQVSATELRAIPLPAEGDIRAVGALARSQINNSGTLLSEIDGIVSRTLNLASIAGVGKQTDAE